jgi:hypothetical protein
MTAIPILNFDMLPSAAHIMGFQHDGFSKGWMIVGRLTTPGTRQSSDPAVEKSRTSVRRRIICGQQFRSGK